MPRTRTCQAQRDQTRRLLPHSRRQLGAPRRSGRSSRQASGRCPLRPGAVHPRLGRCPVAAHPRFRPQGRPSRPHSPTASNCGSRNATGRCSAAVGPKPARTACGRWSGAPSASSRGSPSSPQTQAGPAPPRGSPSRLPPPPPPPPHGPDETVLAVCAKASGPDPGLGAGAESGAAASGALDLHRREHWARRGLRVQVATEAVGRRWRASHGTVTQVSLEATRTPAIHVRATRVSTARPGHHRTLDICVSHGHLRPVPPGPGDPAVVLAEGPLWGQLVRVQQQQQPQHTPVAFLRVRLRARGPLRDAPFASRSLLVPIACLGLWDTAYHRAEAAKASTAASGASPKRIPAGG